AISELRFQVRDQQGVAGVYCPTEATFSVSDDGVTFHRVAGWTRPEDYPAVDCAAPGPDFNGMNFMISSGPIASRGAYARVEIAADGKFLFIDEVEVLRGTDPAQTNYQDDDFDAQLDALGPDWRVFNEDPWAVVGPKSTPVSDAPDATSMEMSLARDEHGFALLAVTNPYFTDFGLHVTTQAWLGDEGASLPQNVLELLHAAPAPTIMFDERADALFSTDTQPVAVTARRVTHLWLHFSVPEDARSGRYTSTLSLTCDGEDCQESKQIALDLEVQPFTLPEQSETSGTYFDWSYSVPEAEAYIAGALSERRAALREEYGMNGHVTYLTPLPPWDGDQPLPPDFLELASALDRHRFAREHLLYLAGSSNWRRNFGGHACYPSAAWADAYAFWIGQIRSFMLGRGVPVTEFAFYPIDEPNAGVMLTAGAGCPEPLRDRLEYYEDAASVIKAVDAQLRVMINSGGTDVAALQSLAERNLVQVWVPHYERYFDSPELIDFYDQRLAAGELVWLYNGPRFRQGHGHLYREGRLVPWTIDDAGLLGYGYWALFAPGREISSSEPVSLWDPLAGSGPPYATVYLDETWDPQTPAGLPTDEGAVPARRLAALRRGIDDVRALELLRHLVALRAGQARCTDQLTSANAVLAEASEAVLAAPSDSSLADAWTDQLDASILDLSRPDDVLLNLDRAGGTRLSWTDRGIGIAYDVAGAALSALRASGTSTASCLVNDLPVTEWDDLRPHPAPGDGEYYLVRTTNGCVDGSWGSWSSSLPENERNLPPSTCGD
ncbi:MAG: hypothetical protein JSV80_07540, partial [Acidobacteriota bacterium]